jgi:transposase
VREGFARAMGSSVTPGGGQTTERLRSDARPEFSLEKSFQKRHKYVTVVCDLEAQRVLEVGDGRGRESLDGFYEGQSEEQLAGVEGIAMGMCGPYFTSTLAHVREAAHRIVFDKFPVVAHLKKASMKCARLSTVG